MNDQTLALKIRNTMGE